MRTTRRHRPVAAMGPPQGTPTLWPDRGKIRAESGETIDALDNWSTTSLTLAIEGVDPDCDCGDCECGEYAVLLDLRRPEVEQLWERLMTWLARGAT